MAKRIGSRGLLIGSVTGLVGLVLLGGAILSVVEDAGYREGVWLAFSVISTTGFGEGPATVAGEILSMILFALGAALWFGVVLSAFEIGLRRAGGYRVGSGDAGRVRGRRARPLRSVDPPGHRSAN